MTDLDEDNFYDENYRFNVEDEEIEDIEYPDEDIEDSADEDIDCDDRYVLDYIKTRQISNDCIPEWLEDARTEEELRNIPTVEVRLNWFKKNLSEIIERFNVSIDNFLLDKELKERVDKFNVRLIEQNKSKIEIEPLYYLTLFVYDMVYHRGFNEIGFLQPQLKQIEKAIDILSYEDAEIVVKVKKVEGDKIKTDRISIVDRQIIDFLFNPDRLNSSLNEDENISLKFSKIDIENRKKRFSNSKVSTLFIGLMVEYFNMGYSSFELIAYLLSYTGWVNKEHLLYDVDRIKRFMGTYNNEISKLVKTKNNIFFY